MALVKYNNNSISAITTAGQLATGSLVPISEQTASGSASISFTTGIDSTYPIYKFEFINIHPATNDVPLKGNFSIDSGSNYNVTKTTTWFGAVHDQGELYTGLSYSAGRDLAQSTSDFTISQSTGNENESSISGYMYLFNPSSSTYVKHFMTETSVDWGGIVGSTNDFGAGYGNTTSSINAIIFRMSSGNIDSGTIKLYGIRDS